MWKGKIEHSKAERWVNCKAILVGGKGKLNSRNGCAVVARKSGLHDLYYTLYILRFALNRSFSLGLSAYNNTQLQIIKTRGFWKIMNMWKWPDP